MCPRRNRFASSLVFRIAIVRIIFHRGHLVRARKLRVRSRNGSIGIVSIICSTRRCSSRRYVEGFDFRRCHHLLLMSSRRRDVARGCSAACQGVSRILQKPFTLFRDGAIRRGFNNVLFLLLVIVLLITISLCERGRRIHVVHRLCRRSLLVVLLLAMTLSFLRF